MTLSRYILSNLLFCLFIPVVFAVWVLSVFSIVLEKSASLTEMLANNLANFGEKYAAKIGRKIARKEGAAE